MNKRLEVEQLDPLTFVLAPEGESRVIASLELMGPSVKDNDQSRAYAEQHDAEQHRFASLFAAAPDLFEACEKAEQRLAKLWSKDTAHLDPDVAALRSALARARGEEVSG